MYNKVLKELLCCGFRRFIDNLRITDIVKKHPTPSSKQPKEIMHFIQRFDG